MIGASRWLPALALALLLAVPAPGSQASGNAQEVVVAVIDTGIKMDHEAFAAGQVVAWYDFTRGDRPATPRATWDAAVQPYDDDGHGTAVAALVGGTGAGQTSSHAPGVKLAIARVTPGGEGQNEWVNIFDAIEWAVDVAGADVVSLSYYGFVPTPGFPLGIWNRLDDELEWARDRGVLPVVLAGNWLADAAPVPMVSLLHAPGYSPDALVVGGAWGENGRVLGFPANPHLPVAPLSGSEPEVTAPFFVRAPTADCNACYLNWQGTSFSTPLVSGMAAHLIQTARSVGMADPGPDRIEELLKWAATDHPAYPPSFEGYGFLGASELHQARAHLLAQTLPQAGDLNKQASAFWVENVQASARQAWSDGP